MFARALATITFAAMIAAACAGTSDDAAQDEPAPTETTEQLVDDAVEPATTTAIEGESVDASARLTNTNVCELASDDEQPCVTVDPIQPDAELIELIDTIHDTGQPDFDFELYGNDQRTIIVDGIPYAQYWQLDNPENYVLHPMVVGRYVTLNARKNDFGPTPQRLIDTIGTPLPNGGVAFYYPNLYPLNRMSGPDYMYSAISQSELLAGFVRVDQLEGTDQSAQHLDAVLAALFYPHEEGGVDLAGVAQLELPLFRANPEIILNGWFHSLLHLDDYAQLYESDEVSSYINDNLDFFRANVGAWYDDDLKISLYSDTSPHRVILDPSEPGTDQDFRVLHDSRASEIGDYVVDLPYDLDGELGGFDSKISELVPSNQNLVATVTCSGLFDSFVVSDSPFTMSIRSGGYNPLRATPDAEGEWQEVTATFDEATGLHSAAVTTDGLICGYPTNFAKANGRNFYHIQHVVAMLLLAESPIVADPEMRQFLRDTASAWYRDIEAFEPMPIDGFESPQTVLEGMNRGKAIVAEPSAAALFERAGIELFPEHQG